VPVASADGERRSSIWRKSIVDAADGKGQIVVKIELIFA
jgi:hypothetical protein